MDGDEGRSRRKEKEGRKGMGTHSEGCRIDDPDGFIRAAVRQEGTGFAADAKEGVVHQHGGLLQDAEGREEPGSYLMSTAVIGFPAMTLLFPIFQLTSPTSFAALFSSTFLSSSPEVVGDTDSMDQKQAYDFLGALRLARGVGDVSLRMAKSLEDVEERPNLVEEPYVVGERRV
jgi:hypothetical protein